ncbi:hypothetical protein A9R05_43230 (plasmid) [Burkholderia sp. KK1]|uniref:hypothetical protein n=1 Tax=Burkholderia sp. M701 TaxID=326454 RepID=UPI000979B0FF|nr:hypothetical protein [Burkholderia sp. M701]AQH05826.1 hypothetical protein A9R05_43230 [Burkholderia sp. KK1]
MFGLDEYIDDPAARARSSVVDQAPSVSCVPVTISEWSAAIELLRAQRGWDDDELCRWIKINPNRLAQCRSGKRALPPAQRLRVLSGLGFPISIERLLGVLSPAIRLAARDSESERFSLKSNVVDQFFDEIDHVEVGQDTTRRLLARLHTLSGGNLEDLTASVGLTQKEWELSCAGQIRLPFRAKRAIVDRFGAEALYKIILELKSY